MPRASAEEEDPLARGRDPAQRDVETPDADLLVLGHPRPRPLPDRPPSSPSQARLSEKGERPWTVTTPCACRATATTSPRAASDRRFASACRARANSGSVGGPCRNTEAQSSRGRFPVRRCLGGGEAVPGRSKATGVHPWTATSTPRRRGYGFSRTRTTRGRGRRWAGTARHAIRLRSGARNSWVCRDGCRTTSNRTRCQALIWWPGSCWGAWCSDHSPVVPTSGRWRVEAKDWDLGRRSGHDDGVRV